MLTRTMRAVAFTAMLLAPAAALAQSASPDQGNVGPGMMWSGPGMMWGGQPGGNGYAGPGMMGGGMMRGCPVMGAMMGGGAMMGRGNYQDSAAAWLDGQLAYAHTELAITAAQEPAWKSYVDAVHDRSAQMWSSHQSMMGAMWQGGLAFDKAYDLHIEIMQSHLDAMKSTRDAALKLYGALSADQQKKASWVLPQSMCMM